MANKDTEFSEQTILNRSYDPVTGVLAVELLGFDGTNNPVRVSSRELAEKVIIDDEIVYKAEATTGSSYGNAVWRVRKIDTTGGNVFITWADGNSNFDNLATDLPGLDYQ